jgi:glycosyltransferase involved in cell wall biosynthesis
MAALQHGVPVVTTLGKSTEEFWLDSGAVALAPAENPDRIAAVVERLLSNSALRKSLGDRGRSVYYQNFDVSRAIARLRHEEFAYAAH